MSRINEAIERAKREGTDPKQTGASWTDAVGPEMDPLAEAPWSFDGVAGKAQPGGALPAQGPLPLAPPPHAPAQRSAGATSVASAPASGVPDPTVITTGGVFGGFDAAVEERVVVSRDIPSMAVEQYRRLAATLHHAQNDRGIRRVLVTSAVAGEGKSLTSTNLALTLSQSYRRRVLLIDGDLRRPTLHQVFQAQNVSGLVDGLRAEPDRKLSIVEISEQLALLTAGRPDPDPMGVLTSERMARVLDEASSKFDWIIVDSPPVALLPDANLLSAMVDVAVLVVHASRTSFDLVQRAIDAVGRERIMGVILNRADASAVHANDHYQAYYDSYNRAR
jgi:protein-tyrosine kinase